MITKPHFTPLAPPLAEAESAEQGLSSPRLKDADPSAGLLGMEGALLRTPPPSEPLGAVDQPGAAFVYNAPVEVMVAPAMPGAPNAGSLAALLDQKVSEAFRTRWNEIQGKFVDEPRPAVQQADALVSEVIEQITLMFASEHSALEGQWNQDQVVSTEDLRQALQRYRSFFNRLVV